MRHPYEQLSRVGRSCHRWLEGQAVNRGIAANATLTEYEPAYMRHPYEQLSQVGRPSNHLCRNAGFSNTMSVNCTKAQGNLLRSHLQASSWCSAVT